MKTTRTHILNKILFEANRVSDESHRKTILKNKFNFMWKNNAWAIQRIDSSVEAWWIVVWLTEAVNVASSKSTPKYDSQMFLVQFTCTKCKRKCFSVCCRTKKTERILWIQKIVKRYVAGQIRLWPLIMKEPNNACWVKQDKFSNEHHFTIFEVEKATEHHCSGHYPNKLFNVFQLLEHLVKITRFL